MTTHNRLLTACAGLTIALTSADAHAAIQFCFDHDIDFSDAGGARDCASTGNCEDIFMNQDVVPLTDAEYLIVGSGEQTTGNTDDDGCTAPWSPPDEDGLFLVLVYTRGLVDGDVLEITDDTGAVASHAFLETLSAGETRHLTFAGDTDAFPLFNTYSALQRALERRPARDPITVDVEVSDTSPCGIACYRGGEDKIYIPTSSNDHLFKFRMAHELGHKIMREVTGGGNSNDCSRGGSGHGMLSVEWNSCAASEGLANFYAAAAWNRSTQDDCWYNGRNGNIFGCQGSDDPTYAMPYIDSVTAPGADLTGQGVELDWMRTFWDMLIAGSTTGKTKWQDLMTFISTVDPWTAQDAYDRFYDASVPFYGTPNRFEDLAAVHSIDH